ncbi:hypothetical protein JW926_04635, partial [Candidatus Sumerlaeota bacterium]|nr:hypothetical protein [Candidatus Sumerlaeota bacterium]
MSHFHNAKFIRILYWILSVIFIVTGISADDSYDSTSLFHSSPPWIPSDNSSHRHTLVSSISMMEKTVVANLEGPAMI